MMHDAEARAGELRCERDFVGWAVLFGTRGPSHYVSRDAKTALILTACGAARNLHGALFESDAFPRCRACLQALSSATA